jgi:hypothetical protein
LNAKERFSASRGRSQGQSPGKATEVTDLKNGATEQTEESEKKTDFSPFSSLPPLLRF